MSVETPAKIAVIGAGPIGLESALYARYLGYDVDLFEVGEIAENVRRWGHVRMFSPFGMNRSNLGLAAITAQDGTFQPPEDDEILTGGQWAERYLIRLAVTDLVADCVHTKIRVISIAREGLLKSECVGDSARAKHAFRILTEREDGEESVSTADVVIDSSGVFQNPNRLGPGGMWAVGQRTCDARIWHGLPDVLGRDREAFAGRSTLLIGSGYSAATTIVALGQLCEEVSETTATWITRRGPHADEQGPIRRLPTTGYLKGIGWLQPPIGWPGKPCPTQRVTFRYRQVSNTCRKRLSRKWLGTNTIVRLMFG